MANTRYGLWTLIQNNGKFSRCRCDCGTERDVNSSDLRQGRSTGCGCTRQKRMAAAQREAVTRHGFADTPTHRTWVDMRRRCNQSQRPDYHRYGGRGIRVCERWDSSFDNFLADMGPKPGPEFTLDRIDPNGNYSPENCRWATRKQQARNTRTNRYVEIDGERMTLVEAAERYGIHEPTFRNRYNNLGWDLMDALTRPVRGS